MVYHRNVRKTYPPDTTYTQIGIEQQGENLCPQCKEKKSEQVSENNDNYVEAKPSKAIDDILHKDAGCTSELDYTGKSSWLLFLKYLDVWMPIKPPKPERRQSLQLHSGQSPTAASLS